MPAHVIVLVWFTVFAWENAFNQLNFKARCGLSSSSAAPPTAAFHASTSSSWSASCAAGSTSGVAPSYTYTGEKKVSTATADRSPDRPQIWPTDSSQVSAAAGLASLSELASHGMSDAALETALSKVFADQNVKFCAAKAFGQYPRDDCSFSLCRRRSDGCGKFSRTEDWLHLKDSGCKYRCPHCCMLHSNGDPDSNHVEFLKVTVLEASLFFEDGFSGLSSNQYDNMEKHGVFAWFCKMNQNSEVDADLPELCEYGATLGQEIRGAGARGAVACAIHQLGRVRKPALQRLSRAKVSSFVKTWVQEQNNKFLENPPQLYKSGEVKPVKEYLCPDEVLSGSWGPLLAPAPTLNSRDQLLLELCSSFLIAARAAMCTL